MSTLFLLFTFLVVHHDGNVFKSVAITPQFAFKRNGKSIELDGFNIQFASGSACEDLFDELTDIVDELKSKEKNQDSQQSEKNGELEVEKIEEIQAKIVTPPTSFGFQAPIFGVPPIFGGILLLS